MYQYQLIALLLGVKVLLLNTVVASELLDHLDEREMSSVAFRLQDEREKRLLLQNDVDIMMLKISQLERNIKELNQSKAPDCPIHWKRHGNSCYYLSEQSTTWLEAGRTCHDRGGHLAEIDNEAESDYLDAEAKLKTGPHWVGGTDIWAEGDWTWISTMARIPDTIKNWNNGQPDNAGSYEHCLEINHVDKGWNDRLCSFKNKFVCEIQI